MEIVSNGYIPGDPRLIDQIVYELKSQGIFDNFRKECIADVDTKPAYQNLRQRVEGSVSGFLRMQRWRPDMNKNHVREMLRKNISESGFLETGVERIVDQVVNPKINSIFLPQVENVVYKYLGIQKPSAFDELKAQPNNRCFNSNARLDAADNLLPSDLEPVSPESESLDRKLDISNESQKLEDIKVDDDESPPFEPLDESGLFMAPEENSVDSHLSGFSGLASHDSNHSFELVNKVAPMEISNQDSHISKQSSDDHLSIVLSEDIDMKTEVNDDSNHSKVPKVADFQPNLKNFSFAQDSNESTTKSDKSDGVKKLEEKPKGDRHRSSDKHKPHHDSKSESRDHKNDKDRKSDRDKKEHRDKNKYGSKDCKDKDRDRKESKSKKDGEGKPDKEHKHDKDREKSKSSSNSKYSSNKDKINSKKELSENKVKENKDSKEEKPKELEYKNSAQKEHKLKDQKDKSEGSKLKSSHNSSKCKSDAKTYSKHEGKSKSDSTDADKTSGKINKKEEKSHRKDEKYHSKNSKHSISAKKDERHERDKKDSKKDKKGSRDDHYSQKIKNSNRRSTDRDSSDGYSGTRSSSCSFVESSSSQQLQKSSQSSSFTNSRSSSGDSGNSDQTEDSVTLISFQNNSNTTENVEEIAQTTMSELPAVKLIKPKFASNIFEARRLMKIRKKLGKIEKQSRMGLLNAGIMMQGSTVSIIEHKLNDVMTSEANVNVSLSKKSNILKKRALKTCRLNLLPSNSIKKKIRPRNHHQRMYQKHNHENVKKDILKEENINNGTISLLQNSVVSKESWDAIEAKHLKNILSDSCNMYSELSEDQVVIETDVLSNNTSTNDVKNELDGDCLYLTQDVPLERQRYCDMLHLLMKQLHESIVKMEVSLKNVCEDMQSPNCVNHINKRLPKVAIIDVINDNEIVLVPNRGSKRKMSDHLEIYNNNNKTSRLSENDLSDDKLNHALLEVNQPTRLNSPSKMKKVKAVDMLVNHHVDNFNLPLSPAESERSFTTGDKKAEKDEGKIKRNSNVINKAANTSNNQRYSTDDLYKPRLQFSSSRRRAAKNQHPN